MRRASSCVLRCVALIVLAILILPAAAAWRLDELSTRDDVLKWIDGYRNRPDPASVHIAMKVLSQRGVLRDSDSAGVYVGFMAGILGAHPAEAAGIVDKVLPGLALAVKRIFERVPRPEPSPTRKKRAPSARKRKQEDKP